MLDGLDDTPRLDASGAGANPGLLAAHDRVYTLQIRGKDPPRVAEGVTDRVPGQGAFPADLTDSRHAGHLSFLFVMVHTRTGST